MRKRADSALGIRNLQRVRQLVARGDAGSTIRASEVISPLLSTQTRLRLKATLRRLAAGYRVSLQEIIDLQTCADRDQTVAAWLRRARHRRVSGWEERPADPLWHHKPPIPMIQAWTGPSIRTSFELNHSVQNEASLAEMRTKAGRIRFHYKDKSTNLSQSMMERIINRFITIRGLFSNPFQPYLCVQHAQRGATKRAAIHPCLINTTQRTGSSSTKAKIQFKPNNMKSL